MLLKLTQTAAQTIKTLKKLGIAFSCLDGSENAQLSDEFCGILKHENRQTDLDL